MRVTYFGLAFTLHVCIAACDDEGAHMRVRAIQQTQALLPALLDRDDPQLTDGFGQSVAIDGDIAIVGAPGRNVGDNTQQGAVYVFRRVDSQWLPDGETPLLATDGQAFDQFGSSVAISGNVMLIGAPGRTVDGNSFQGSVYTFVWRESTWTENGTPLISLDVARGAEDRFGAAIAFSGDSAVVGVPGAEQHRGAATVFRRNESNSTWGYEGTLIADRNDRGEYDRFGSAVAISGSSTILIGAPGRPRFDAKSMGAAYVFVPDSHGTWHPQAGPLTGCASFLFSAFGSSVALSGDAVTAMVMGDPFVSNVGCVFVRKPDRWAEGDPLIPGTGEHSSLPSRVALSGTTGVVGAPGVDLDLDDDQGAAHVFVPSDAGWTQRQMFAPNAQEYDAFGTAVAISGKTAVVSAARGGGVVYAFDIPSWTAGGTSGQGGGAVNISDGGEGGYGGSAGATREAALEFDRKGCNCRTIGSRRMAWSPSLTGLSLLLLFVSRRRRR